MNITLILLGAGATAAISGGRLPVSKDFFSSRNSVWKNNRTDYPHLDAACNKVASLKGTPGDSSSLTLTDAWLFLDTVLKYHFAKRGIEYNKRLLGIRYSKMGDAMPPYLREDCLNTHYSALCADMYPLNSALKKQIYDTFPRDDPISYFLVIGGWELKHLLYRTYAPQTQEGRLYGILMASFADPRSLAVISFNYDIFFEAACHRHGVALQLLLDDKAAPDAGAVHFCKPHGGWNILHTDDQIEPPSNLADFIDDKHFDKVKSPECHEQRPAIIPYFSYPDEISVEHRTKYPQVGQFFLNQHKQMEALFQNARNVISIGYSFSEDDCHVRQVVEGIAPCECGRGKRLFCILRGDSRKKQVMKLWNFDKEDGTLFEYCQTGFDHDCIDKIRTFLGS
jgi:hypothetical protein